MDQKERIQSTEKPQRLNRDIEPRIGMEVQDTNGHKGIIVKIELPEGEITQENHGTLYVWQSERTNYGSDNCEHYCLNNWNNFLKIL